MRINAALTIQSDAGVKIFRMPQDSLSIDDKPGSRPGQRVLTLNGALVMTTMFQFQAMVRADTSRSLIIDFTGVPYVDSPGSARWLELMLPASIVGEIWRWLE